MLKIKDVAMVMVLLSYFSRYRHIWMGIRTDVRTDSHVTTKFFLRSMGNQIWKVWCSVRAPRSSNINQTVLRDFLSLEKIDAASQLCEKNRDCEKHIGLTLGEHPKNLRIILVEVYLCLFFYWFALTHFTIGVRSKV